MHAGSNTRLPGVELMLEASQWEHSAMAKPRALDIWSVGGADVEGLPVGALSYGYARRTDSSSPTPPGRIPPGHTRPVSPSLYTRLPAGEITKLVRPREMEVTGRPTRDLL
jgi:hypothetical protein